MSDWHILTSSSGPRQTCNHWQMLGSLPILPGISLKILLLGIKFIIVLKAVWPLLSTLDLGTPNIPFSTFCWRCRSTLPSGTQRQILLATSSLAMLSDSPGARCILAWSLGSTWPVSGTMHSWGCSMNHLVCPSTHLLNSMVPPCPKGGSAGAIRKSVRGSALQISSPV